MTIHINVAAAVSFLCITGTVLLLCQFLLPFCSYRRMADVYLSGFSVRFLRVRADLQTAAEQEDAISKRYELLFSEVCRAARQTDAFEELLTELFRTVPLRKLVRSRIPENREQMQVFLDSILCMLEKVHVNSQEVFEGRIPEEGLETEVLKDICFVLDTNVRTMGSLRNFWEEL